MTVPRAPLWATRGHERRAGPAGRRQPAEGPGGRPHEPQGHRPGPGLPAGPHPVPGQPQPPGGLLRPPGEPPPGHGADERRQCHAFAELWFLMAGHPVPGRAPGQPGAAEGGAGDAAEPPERHAEVSQELHVPVLRSSNHQ